MGTNGSRKTVKCIKCTIVQHVEVTMTNTHFTRNVASMESKEGCPITPGSNLVSSTLISQGQNPNDALGIVISYSVRVALNCGAIGGELVADLPFKLVHPSPAIPAGKAGEDNIVFEDFARLRRGMSIDQN